MNSERAGLLPKIKNVLNIASKRETTDATLCAAIKAMRVVEFYYRGNWRTVEPYCLGIVAYGRADNESLLCWQTAGVDDLDEEMGWRLYRISDIEDISITKEQFAGDRPNYHPDRLAFAKVICCVGSEALANTVARSVMEAPPLGPDTIARSVMESPPPGPDTVAAVLSRPYAVSLSHNQLMSYFYTAHPHSLLEKYREVAPGATLQTLPERLSSKKRPVAAGFDVPVNPATWREFYAPVGDPAMTYSV